jgi:hypothetical protein
VKIHYRIEQSDGVDECSLVLSDYRFFLKVLADLVMLDNKVSFLISRQRRELCRYQWRNLNARIVSDNPSLLFDYIHYEERMTK